MSRELACAIEDHQDDLHRWRCACGWPKQPCLKMYPELRPGPMLITGQGTATEAKWPAALWWW